MIRSDELRSKKDKFYSYFIKEALKHNDGKILEARIKIDGSGDRTFRKSFLSYLRRELNNDEKKVMKNCKMEDSKGNVLIQLADIVAGSINRSYSEKPDAQDYKKIHPKA